MQQRLMLSVLAAAAAIAAMSASQASAGPLPQLAHVQSMEMSEPAGFRIKRNRRGTVRRFRRGPGNMTAGQRRLPSPATAGAIQAMNVYLQWRRRCLDNILPECP